MFNDTCSKKRMQEVIVSVIMPAYNAERFIAESIESVIEQSESRWELLIIDDGSTDATAEVIKKYCCTDQRIFYYYQENRGQGNARNNAIKLSKGAFIALIDSDDRWAQNKLEVQLNCLKNYEADLIYSDMLLINEQGAITKDTYGVNEETVSGKDGIKMMLKANKIATSTVIARKKVLLEAGGFDEQRNGHYGEDYALWLRMLQRGAVLRGMNDKLAHYRSHANQSTRQKASMMHVLELLKKIDFGDNDLNSCRNKALAIWISRFVKLNPDIHPESFKQIIAMYPYKAYKLLLEIIYGLSGGRATIKAISFFNSFL